MSFPRYPKYKNSGVEWLGEVPEHWQIQRVKSVSAFTTSGPRGWSERVGEEGSLFVQSGDLNDSMRVEFAEAKRVQVGDDAETTRTRLLNGDVVVCITGAKTGNVAVCVAVPEPAYVNQHLCLVRPNERILPDFMGVLLKSRIGQTHFELSQYGLKQGLSLEDVKDAPVLVPPLDEQERIAEFLDRETGKIDELVAEQQRLMELLKEKRQAVISHAVTKGLNPRAPMKPSGIDWLGDVPEHWTIARLSYGATVENGTTPSRDKVEYWFGGSIPWLSSGEVNQYRINEATEFITDLALAECSLRLLPKGTIVVGMIGQGKTRGLAATLEIEAAINQNLAGLVPRPNLKSDYLLYIFQSVYEYLREYGRGGNQAALNCEILSALKVPMPPLVEQSQICAHLEARLSEFEALAAESQKAIDLLQERRTALISAAVTGQIDVRKLAAA